MSAYVIVARDLVSERVIGPFDSAAQASGRALVLFGPREFGCPVKWNVRPIESPEEAQ
jgi:hypothetical protein